MDMAQIQIRYTFLASHLERRKQRTKVNGSYSNFDDIFRSVPQGSTLGLLLFYICICDLFFEIGDSDIASSASDNTPYTFSSKLDAAFKKPRSHTIKIFEWFPNNRLKSNAEKCNLITSSTLSRGGSRAAATSKMECFVIIINGFQPLTIITEHSILDVAVALDLPLLSSRSSN